MYLTDFFKNCASALKNSFLGPESKNPPVDEEEVTLTDQQALELFAEIRAMDFSHKSERGDGAACDLRAYEIGAMLREQGIKIRGIGWISSPPAPNSTIPNYLIRPPVDINYARRAESYNEHGLVRVKDNQPFNVHAAALVPTVEGRCLAFDTYFYETPPEQEQWIDDFKPYEEGVDLEFQIADPDYVHFYEIGSFLPQEGSWSRIFQRSRNRARVQSELRHLDSNPVDTPLKAKWLEERHNPAPSHEADPRSDL